MSDVNNDIPFSPAPISEARNYELNDAEGNRESTPLTEALVSVHNSNHELYKGNPSCGISARFKQAWQWLSIPFDCQVFVENGSNEEGTELQAILTDGENLHRQADLLRASETQEIVPHAWKGSIMQRCLVGLGLIGTVGYAGYRSYNARTSTGSQQSTLQPSNTPPDIVLTGGSQGGNLGDSFGHHSLHHDDPANRTRHGRRHLPMATSSIPLPINSPDNVRVEPVNKCYKSVGKGRLITYKEVPCANEVNNNIKVNPEQPPYHYVYTSNQPQKCKTQKQKQRCQKTHENHHKKNPDKRFTSLVLNVGKTQCLCPPPVGDDVRLTPPKLQKKKVPPSTRRIPVSKPQVLTPASSTVSGTEKGALTERPAIPHQQPLSIPRPEKRYIISPDLGKGPVPVGTASSVVPMGGGNDVRIEKMYDFSCIDERNNMSWTDIIRQVGKTLGSPVKSLAAESQVVHHHNTLGKGCPSEHESLHLREITEKIDAVLSQVMPLLPGANPVIVLQQIVGPALEIYADELDGKPLDQQKINDINQQVLFLSRQEIQTLSPEEKIGLFTGFPETKIKNRFNVINGEVAVKIGEETPHLKTDSYSFPYIEEGDVRRYIHFNNRDNVWVMNSESDIRSSPRLSHLKIDTYRSEYSYDIKKSITITDNDEIVAKKGKEKYLLINGVEVQVIDGVEKESFFPARGVGSGDIIKKGVGEYYFEAESAPIDLEVAKILNVDVNEFVGGGDKTSIKSDLFSYDVNDKRYLKYKNLYHPLEDGTDACIELIDGNLAVIKKTAGRIRVAEVVKQKLPDIQPLTENVFITSDLKMKLEQDGAVLTNNGLKIEDGMNSNTDAEKSYLGVNGKAYKAIYSEYSPWILIDNKKIGHPLIPVLLYDDVLIRGRDDFIEDTPSLSSCRLKRSPGNSAVCMAHFSPEAEKILTTLKPEAINTELTPVEGFPGFYVDLHTKKTYIKFKDNFFLSEYIRSDPNTPFKNGVLKVHKKIGWKLLSKMKTAGKFTYHDEGDVRFIKTIDEEIARITEMTTQDSKKISGLQHNRKIELTGILRETRNADRLYKTPEFRAYVNTVMSKKDVNAAIGRHFFKGNKNWGQTELSMIGDDMDFRLRLSANRLTSSKYHAFKVLSSAINELDNYTLNTRLYLRTVLGTANEKLVADFAKRLSLRFGKIKKALDDSKIILCHSNVIYGKPVPEHDPIRDADFPGGNWDEVHWKPNFDEYDLKRTAMAFTYAKGDEIYLNVDKIGGIDPTSTTKYLRQSYSIEPFMTLIHEASHKNDLAKDLIYISIENNDYIPILDAIDELADSFSTMQFHNPELLSPLLSDYFRTAAPYNKIEKKELFKSKNLHAIFKYDPSFRAAIILNIPDFLAKLASDIDINKFVRT